MWSGLKTIEILGQTGLIIALSSTSAVAVFSWIFYLPFDLRLLTIVFMLTVGSYAIDRLIDARKDKVKNVNKDNNITQYKSSIMLLIIITLIIGIILAFSKSFIFGILSVLAPIFVFLYSFEPNKKTKSIKKIPYLKDIVIAAGWTALVLVVLVYNQIFINLAVIFFSVGVLGKFFVMAVLYDFKDISMDLKNEIRTLPNTIGERNTKTILYIINTLATIWIIILVYTGKISTVGYIFLPAWGYQTLLIWLVSQQAPLWIYYVLCDLEQVIFFGVML